jgi:hypothetical protein
MTTEQKYAHLRDVATKGADAHYVLVNENKNPDRDTCAKHYKVFVPDGAPAENGDSKAVNSKEWNDLSLDYFVDSCVAGQPREIKTRPTGPAIGTSPPAPPSSPLSSPSPHP